MATLKAAALRGGAYMAVRQVLGMAISLLGLVYVARVIGPKAYGAYAAALGLYQYAMLVAPWGVNVWLVRKKDQAQADDYHQAFTVLAVSGVACWAVAAALGGLAQQWSRIDNLQELMIALFAGLPLQLVAMVPAATLERAMNYRLLAWVELGGQAILAATAITLAATGAGAAAPLGGWLACQVWTCTLCFALSGYRPRLRWSRKRLRDMLGYGLGYASSLWVWQLRVLVNPLVVARYLGPEAAATVAVTVRVVEALTFIRAVGWRVSIAAMGRVQDDKPRLARAVAQGMRMQVLVTGPMLAAFALAGPWVIPLAVGAEWTPVVQLFPYVALGYLVNGVFSLHSSALYVLGRNWHMAAFHAVHVALFAGAALVLVAGLGQGLAGYGQAEMVALAAYAVIQRFTVRAVGPVSVVLCLTWAAGFAGPLFAPLLGPWAWCTLALVLLTPQTWRMLGGTWSMLKETRHA